MIPRVTWASLKVKLISFRLRLKRTEEDPETTTVDPPDGGRGDDSPGDSPTPSRGRRWPRRADGEEQEPRQLSVHQPKGPQTVGARNTAAATGNRSSRRLPRCYCCFIPIMPSRHRSFCCTALRSKFTCNTPTDLSAVDPEHQ